MPYTIEDFHRDIALKTLPELPPEKRLRGLPPEDRLRGLSKEELAQLRALLEQDRSEPD